MKTYTEKYAYNTKEDILTKIQQTIHTNSYELDIIVPYTCDINPNISNVFFKSATQHFKTLLTNTSLQQHKLGQINLINVAKHHNNNIYFCQMFTDKKSRYRSINYIHLINCMLEIRNICFKIKTQDKTVEIHSPKFGIGLSGGRWSTIADLITDCWNGIPTYIYNQ